MSWIDRVGGESALVGRLEDVFLTDFHCQSIQHHLACFNTHLVACIEGLFNQSPRSEEFKLGTLLMSHIHHGDVNKLLSNH